MGERWTFLRFVDGILYLEQARFVTGEILHIEGGQAGGAMPPPSSV
jgi:hypothetical protein